MAFLIDTNILAEKIKKDPDPGVAAWLQQQSELVVSSATIYEIEFGLKELERQRGKKAKSVRVLFEWFEILLPYLTDIPFNRSIALKAAELSVQKRKQGLQIDVNDMIIAATAVESGRTLVTRNLKDFDRISGLTLLNPFS